MRSSSRWWCGHRRLSERESLPLLGWKISSWPEDRAALSSQECAAACLGDAFELTEVLNRSAPAVTATSRSACWPRAAANAGGSLGGPQVTCDYAPWLDQQQVQQVRLLGQALDFAAAAAGSGAAPGGAAPVPPPSQALLAGRGDRVRPCGRHHFLVTCSWNGRNGRVPWLERHLGLAGRVEGPHARARPCGPSVARCGCASSLTS